MNTEKVIFRREYDRYRKEWTFLAVFPETGANPGCYAAVPFRFLTELNGSRTTIFEAFCEIACDYYYQCTRIIHRTDPIIPELLSAISRYYSAAFQVCEKVM